MSALGVTLRLRADEVVPGDEILSGPQGPIPAAPTVLDVYWRSPDGVIVARLIDEDGTGDALWTPDTAIKVWRRAGVGPQPDDLRCAICRSVHDRAIRCTA